MVDRLAPRVGMPVMEVHTAAGGSSKWRRVVVPEACTLHNLFRAVAYSFGKEEEEVEGAKAVAFTYGGQQLKALKSAKLESVGGGAFLRRGKAALACTAGGDSYTITAVKRSIGGPTCPYVVRWQRALLGGCCLLMTRTRRAQVPTPTLTPHRTQPRCIDASAPARPGRRQLPPARQPLFCQH